MPFSLEGKNENPWTRLRESRRSVRVIRASNEFPSISEMGILESRPPGAAFFGPSELAFGGRMSFQTHSPHV